MKIFNKYKITLFIALVFVISFMIYDIIFKSYDKFSWILADSFFGAGLLLFAYGLISYASNKGGYSSIRYYFRKRKDKKENKRTPDYADFIQEEGTRDYKSIMICSLILILLSFVFSI